MKSKRVPEFLNQQGIVLQTVIITAVLSLASTGAGVVVYNVVRSESTGISQNAQVESDGAGTNLGATRLGTLDASDDGTGNPIGSPGGDGKVGDSGVGDTGDKGDEDKKVDEDKEETEVPPPTTVSAIADDFLLAAGGVYNSGAHACVMGGSNGEVKCWGNNENGQLGNDGTSTQPTATAGFVLAGQSSETSTDNLMGAKAIAAGESHTCAIVGDNRDVYCWGSDGIMDQPLPGRVPSGQQNAVQDTYLQNASDISAGFNYTCATVGADDEVYCWGAGIGGELPDETAGNKAVPAGPILTGAKAISAGKGNNGVHACAVLIEGAVMCWGSEHNPVQVPAIDGSSLEKSALIVSAGTDHTCAIMETGAVMCWGEGSSGQLGSSGSSNEPKLVPAIDGTADDKKAFAVSAGDRATCSVLQSGAALCWGDSDILGGSMIAATPPASVTNIDGGPVTKSAVVVTTAGSLACALLLSGAVLCWGGGNVGGSVLDSSTPVEGIRNAQTATS